MFLQRIDRILLHVDQIAILQDLIVIRGRLIAYRLLHVLQRHIGRVDRIASLVDASPQGTIIERHPQSNRIREGRIISRIVRCILIALISFAIQGSARSAPGQRRPHLPTIARQVPSGRIDIRQRRLDIAVVLQRHLHAVLEIQLHGISRHSSARNRHHHQATDHHSRQFVIHTIILFQDCILP